jgi:Mg-chelatase subunit ChlD
VISVFRSPSRVPCPHVAVACGVVLAAALALAALDARAAEKRKPAAPAKPERARLELSIDSPEKNAVIGDPGGMAFVAGKALAHFGKLQTFDILFVVDASDSTAAPSGADVDGDGKVGARAGGPLATVFGKLLPNNDRGDSVLAAEISAVRTLVDQLDPRTTRVGVVTFSGDNDPLTPDASTVVPLTSDFARVEKGLDEILDFGPNGMTNMVSGVLTGMIELLGTQSAYSEKRDGARRVMIFLTDGVPTLPYMSQPASNVREAIHYSLKAAKADIRIDTYAIGEEALSEPIVAVEMARVTNGVFTPVRDPRDLRAIFESIDFAEIGSLEIKNKTSGQPAAYKIQNPDGSFAALVPMREGLNVLEVQARATDGSEGQARVPVRFLGKAEVQPLSPRLVAQRNRLLENRLLDLQRRRVKIETDAAEEVRRDLQLEIQAERKAAEKKSEEAKKRLDIRVEKGEGKP